MENEKPVSGIPPAVDLRRKAERRVRDAKALRGASPAEADIRALVHELEVHQVELEMQNEELLRTQAAAERVSQRYSDLFDFAPIGYYLVGPDGEILEINLAGASLLGLDRSAVANRRLEHWVAPEHRANFSEFCQRALATETRQRCEIRLLKANQAIEVLVEGTTTRDAGQYGRALRLAIIDITERKRAEESLQLLNTDLETRVAERTAELQRRAEQLRRLAVEVMQAEEQARHRLAQVLHDQLQQLLVAATMKLGVLSRRIEDERLLDTIGQLRDLLDQSIAESRSLTVELSPPVLRERGLVGGLEWLARRAEEKHGLTIEIDAEPDGGAADEALQVFLFHAVRELLLNVAKHAETDRASIQVRRTEDHQIRLEVSDRGKGFDAAEPCNAPTSSGFGMVSIRERLELLGGRMEVDSIPGKGTQVTILVPATKEIGEALAAGRIALPLPEKRC